MNSDSVINDAAFIVGDLYVSLIHTDSNISLAVMKCVAIEEKGLQTEQVVGESMQFAASKIQLYRQILDMKEIIQNDEHRLQSTEGETEPQSVWIWTGSYVKLDVKSCNGARPLIGKEARKTLVIKIASHLCQSINPQIIEADSLEQFGGGGGITWAITESELHILIEQLWQTV